MDLAVQLELDAFAGEALEAAAFRIGRAPLPAPRTAQRLAVDAGVAARAAQRGCHRSKLVPAAAQPGQISGRQAVITHAHAGLSAGSPGACGCGRRTIGYMCGPSGSWIEVPWSA